MTRGWGAALAVATLAAPSAGSELAVDAAALTRAWSAGGRVIRLRPRLLERGETRLVRVPVALADPASSWCTSVVVLGTTQSAFVLRFLPAAGEPSWPEGETPEPSVAGAAQLVRCGERKAMLSRLAVEMRSPRAVVEAMVVSAPAPMPPLVGALPHRDPGPRVADERVPPHGFPGTAEARARAAEARARRDGATTKRLTVQAGDSGQAELGVDLDPGCHQLTVIAEEPRVGGDRVADIDAELVDSGGQVLARDDGESPDASLAACVGGARMGQVRLLGARPGASVIVVAARAPLPQGLPERWSEETRANVAATLRAPHPLGFQDEPVYERAGVQGITVLPVPVEPGACYLAVVAGQQSGEPAIALTVRAAGRVREVRAPFGSPGAAVAFCADTDELARMDVDARGAGESWITAVWRVGRRALGAFDE
ncbi:MAG: hypothetical protein IT376_15650 [Polyangiaceae bacterium]|nr:hypothetical protein [Polyangiaceae bacterium]